ncbi:MAG: triosephosphate isomerase [Alphaproteobacteria bacterium]|nr:triosephosphate isomerase [Alphaproteobacteria bacterium]
MKKLIAGNWKMNLGRNDAGNLARNLAEKAAQANDKYELILCPPSVWLTDVADAIKGSAVKLGAQDVHEQDKGAFTGNLSANMLKEAGAAYALIGHSERRQYHREDNVLIKSKAENAIKNGLIPIICVGEVEEDRNAGRQNEVVGQQIAESLPASGEFVVAYEPVWAIGTGKTATPEDVRAMHAFIRSALAKAVDRAEQVAILYGGSVKAANAPEILATPNVDGVLVGGASLDEKEFWAIAQAA